MRNAFYEYYDLTNDERDRLWDKALIVLDTNVLLSLYRLQSEARREILAAITKYKERLWMPFQIGWEYHEHRLEEACRPVDSLRRLKDKVNSFTNEIEKDYGKHPYLKDYKSIKRTLDSLNDKINKLTEVSILDCPNFLHNDAILAEISNLYDGKVGKPYTDEQLTEIYKKGESRYDKKIPPGYKDKDKKTGDHHRFGDLIIWQQMLEKSKEDDCDILFITDDKKEDWWQMYNSDKIGPRRELIAEFRTFTGNHLIGFYTPDRFLSIANERKDVSVKKATIDEVKLSDLFFIENGSIFGESSHPGQFATDPFLAKQNSLLGESEPSKATMPGLRGEKFDLPGVLGTPFGKKSLRHVGSFSSKPFEIKEAHQDNNGIIETSLPSGDTEINDGSKLGESEEAKNDCNSK